MNYKKKIGILGGGQLGRMFLQAAISHDVHIRILDPQPDAPCAAYCADFVCADFKDYDSVLQFGMGCDVIGIEIEHVNIEALQELQRRGKTVIPEPRVLALIQDKGLQKQFYAQHQLPTAPFRLWQAGEALPELPFVQKTRRGGYDGKGVQIIQNQEDIKHVWEVPSVMEALCPVAKELAVLVVRNGRGESVVYPLLEMVFEPRLNLVEWVDLPAQIDAATAQKAQEIALQAVEALQGTGLFAVELLLSETGEIWINEIAPRVHNSAHLTIEACESSQFDQMVRVLADLPLGSSKVVQHAAMWNLIGVDGVPASAYALDGVYPHWYGKGEAKAGRKMGHITVGAQDAAQLAQRKSALRQALREE